jgi:WD40 repeat protein
VLGATGPVATLTCGGHLRCGAATFERVDTFGRVATLGPGADEVTVARGPRTLQVIGYDGALRQTIDLDLPASVSYGAGGRQLAWTPDGSRLAVVTGSYVAMNDVWLVDRSGEAQHAYRGRVWSLGGWSPDGQSLLLDIDARPRTGGHYSGSYGADVVVLRHVSEGSSPALTPLTLYHSNRHFDWAGNVAWSPDGTRIAVRTGGSIVEISADNGSVIAEHPHDNGWLIWPARAG